MLAHSESVYDVIELIPGNFVCFGLVRFCSIDKVYPVMNVYVCSSCLKVEFAVKIEMACCYFVAVPACVSTLLGVHSFLCVSTVHWLFLL